MRIKHESVSAPDLIGGSGPRKPVFRPGYVAALVVLLIAGGIVAIFGAGLVQKPSSQESRSPALTVSVAEVTERVIDRTISITGGISAWDPLAIGAEVNGLKIESVQVEEGNLVSRGQVLAVLNSSVLRASLEKERARLSRSKANLEKAIQPNRPQDILTLKAALAQASALVAQEEASLGGARANLDNARSNSSRYAMLSRQGAVSAQEVEARQTAEKTAEADVRNAEQRLAAAKFFVSQARQRLDLAQEGGRQEDILMARAETREIEANIKQIEAQIAQTVIRAPSDGTIIKRDAHLGDISVTTKPLFQMIRDNRLEVRAQVPEHDLLSFASGQPVEISGVAQDLTRVSGRVREVSPAVDATTRLGTVRIDIPYSPDLRVGMFVHGKVKVGREPVLAVPASAVIDRDDRSVVFVVGGDDTVICRPVTTGDRVGELVEIRSGLAAGERVVNSGGGFLKDGDLVRIGELSSQPERAAAEK